MRNPELGVWDETSGRRMATGEMAVPGFGTKVMVRASSVQGQRGSKSWVRRTPCFVGQGCGMHRQKGGAKYKQYLYTAYEAALRMRNVQ
jgi:hypothetical protein